MGLRDTLKEDREKLKGKSFREKAGFFMDYYKWYVIVLAAVIAFVGVTVYQKATEPKTRLTGVLFNVSQQLAEDELQQLIGGFCEEQGFEKGKETVLLHTDLTWFEGEEFLSANYESTQVLTAWVLAGDVDFIIADASLMEQLANGGYLMEFPAGEGDTAYFADVSHYSALQSIYGNLSGELTLGIPVSTENTELILAFMDYLNK